MPALIGHASAQGATIKIGMCAPVPGPAAEAGRYAQTGAKLALDALAIAVVGLLPMNDDTMHILVQTASYSIAAYLGGGVAKSA